MILAWVAADILVRTVATTALDLVRTEIAVGLIVPVSGRRPCLPSAFLPKGGPLLTAVQDGPLLAARRDPLGGGSLLGKFCLLLEAEGVPLLLPGDPLWILAP